jgi:F420-dependent oxidoreductase-like protein
MRIGLVSSGLTSIDSVVEQVAEARDAGFASFWLAQIFELDALTTLAVAGREVDGIELGTAVVPTFPRHPMMLAQQALTTNAACGGRLVLGIGLSHRIVVENFWGLTFEQPLRHMREYLSVLAPLIREKSVAFTGETCAVSGQIQIEADPCPIVLAALGPKMLELAGTVGDGTVTWMAGPNTLASHVVPTITAAAEAAGRPPPRVVVGLPVYVTDDPDAARERASEVYAVYGGLPSYRAMLDREGGGGPESVAVVGDENAVRTQIEHLADIGITDFSASVYAPRAERARTLDLLRSMLL